MGGPGASALGAGPARVRRHYGTRFEVFGALFWPAWGHPAPFFGKTASWCAATAPKITWLDLAARIASVARVALPKELRPVPSPACVSVLKLFRDPHGKSSRSLRMGE